MNITKSILLEYIHHVSPFKSDIIVDCEDEDECKEDPRSTNKVPDVVTVEEIEKNAFPVVFPL